MAGRKKSKRKAALAVQPTAEAFESFRAAGVAIGVDPLSMERTVARLQGRSLSTSGARLKLDDRELLGLIDDGIARAFGFLDDVALGNANARDVATVIGILADKRKHLRADSPEDLDGEDLGKLDELLAAVNEELARRGKLIDVTPGAAPAENRGNGSAP